MLLASSSPRSVHAFLASQDLCSLGWPGTIRTVGDDGHSAAIRSPIAMHGGTQLVHMALPNIICVAPPECDSTSLLCLRVYVVVVAQRNLSQIRRARNSANAYTPYALAYAVGDGAHTSPGAKKGRRAKDRQPADRARCRSLMPGLRGMRCVDTATGRRWYLDAQDREK